MMLYCSFQYAGCSNLPHQPTTFLAQYLDGQLLLVIIVEPRSSAIEVLRGQTNGRSNRMV